MTTNHTHIPEESGPVETRAAETGDPRTAVRGPVGRLFAAALDGDRRAEAALHTLGGFDDTAHRASWALLNTHTDPSAPIPPDVLASLDRTLAALRDHHRPTS